MGCRAKKFEVEGVSGLMRLRLVEESRARDAEEFNLIVFCYFLEISCSSVDVENRQRMSGLHYQVGRVLGI